MNRTAHVVGARGAGWGLFTAAPGGISVGSRRLEDFDIVIDRLASIDCPGWALRDGKPS